MANKKGEEVKTYLVPKQNLESIIFCSTDELRDSINGLIIDKEKCVTVASDGHFMVITPLADNPVVSPPDWEKCIPVKSGQIKIAFNPSYLIKLLQYWEKNVDKDNITLEFYPQDNGSTEMLKAENKEKGVIALLTARRIPD